MHQQRPLWAYFDRLWTAAMGYPARNFAFTPGQLPMATLRESLAGIITYYIIIFGGREIMKRRAPFELKRLFIVHNFVLTCVSFALLSLFLEELTPTVLSEGIYCSVCEKRAGWTKPLELLYYLNYLTKYLEFVDTMFLVLKKKPLTFLHTYHHGATAFLCYMELDGETPVSWVPIVLNLMVHTIMYYYYFQSARGVKIWWKKYITVVQIVQFVLDLFFIYWTSYNLVVSRYFPNMWRTGTCDGSLGAAITGNVILTSYLFLFIAFYTSNYRTPRQSREGKLACKVGDTDVQSFATTSTAVDPLVSQANEALKKVNGRQMQVNGFATRTS